MSFGVKKCRKINAWIIFVIILAIQVTALIGWGISKKGYFIDELFTYGLSNSDGWRIDFYDMYDDYLNNWHDPSMFHDYLTVQKDGRFDFAGVVENVSADVHPPVYFMLIHAICSLMPDVFTKWFGIMPNILFFIITQCLLYILSRELFGTESYNALVPAVIYGFSIGAINSVLLIRAYMMLAMLCTLQFYIHVKLWNAVQRGNRKQEIFLLAALAGSTVLGFLTQYYYIIFAFFISAAYSVFQMLRRKWAHFARYAAAMFGGLGIAYILFPMCLQQILGKSGVNTYRGEEAFENFKNSNLWQRLGSYTAILNSELFGGLLKYAMILGVLFIVVRFVRGHLTFSECSKSDGFSIEIAKRRKENTSPLTLTVRNADMLAVIAGIGIIGYTVILSKVAAFETDRYIFCIYPLIILCFCYAFAAISKRVFKSGGMAVAVMMAVLLLCDTFGYNGNGICYLYKGDEEKYNRFDEFSNTAVVYVTQGDWSNVSNMLYFTKVESVYCLPQENIGDLSAVLDEYSKTHAQVVVVIEEYVYHDQTTKILWDIIDATDYDEYQHEFDSVYLLTKTIREGELSSGYYSMKTDDGRALVVEDDSVDNLANVRVVSGDSGTVFFARKEGTQYEMTFVHSNKMLDVDKGIAADGTNIQQYEWNGMGAQDWMIVPADDGNGYYVLFKSDYAMTENLETGNVELKNVADGEAQRWFFEHVEQ